MKIYISRKLNTIFWFEKNIMMSIPVPDEDRIIDLENKGEFVDWFDPYVDLDEQVEDDKPETIREYLMKIEREL